MSLVTSRPHPATRLRNEADALWATYQTTVCTGGTPEQRSWAFNRALKAEERAHNAERGSASR